MITLPCGTRVPSVNPPDPFPPDQHQPETVSDEKVVHGAVYRWNYFFGEIEIFRFNSSHWDRSAFSGIVKDALQTKKMKCFPSEEPRVIALMDAFGTIIEDSPKRP